MKHFSEREEEILKIISKKRTMTLQKIAEELFMHDHPDNRPFDAEISVGNSIRRIIKKCQHHKLPWTLSKTRTSGKMYITKETV